MIINIETQEQISEYQFRTNNPDASFPADLTDEVLAPFGFANLNYPIAPVAQNNQRVVADGVEEIDGKWFVKYKLVALDASETQAYADQVRAERDELLAKTDWRFRSDLTPSQQWKDYCQALRDVPEQSGFPFSVNWPVEPINSESV